MINGNSSWQILELQWLLEKPPRVLNFQVFWNLKCLELKTKDDIEIVGTEQYISPEAIYGKKSEINFSTDLWSLGVIIWQLFSKENDTPF